MSKKAYSTDLRVRVINHIKSGNTQIRTSKTFNISTSTVSRWWIIYNQEDRASCKARGGSKGKIDVESLKEFVTNNPDKTLSEIGIVFGVRASSIYNRLKALNFSYKKKPLSMWKQVK
jgi:transposase